MIVADEKKFELNNKMFYSNSLLLNTGQKEKNSS